jgi:penicillin-binding protein 1A
MVGGANFDKSEFIRATQMHRQVGSTFKTLVYGAAIAHKPPPGTSLADAIQQRFTLATILQDAPIVMQAKDADLSAKGKALHSADDDEWKPHDFNEKYYGDTPLRTAFVLSRNLPTIQLAQKVGLREVIAFARKLGIESDLQPDLSIALGSASLTLMEICKAHAVFPSGGIAVQPHFIERVTDRDGKTVFDLQQILDSTEPKQLVDPKAAYVMTQLMVDVARAGTASEAAAKLKRISGGKTGTSSDYNDAWYIGFTPEILTGVWVGYDQLRSLGTGETGGEAALPIWLDYMQAATKDLPGGGKFEPPKGVVKVKIDRASGKLAYAGEDPQNIVETWFIEGTEPQDYANQGKINDEPNLFEADPGLR